jgi:hypothetical protein
MAWLAHLVFAGILLAAALTGAAHAQNIESLLRPGDVIRDHAKWEDNCASCHVRFDRAAQDRLCADCHKDIGNDLRTRRGFHGKPAPQPCRTCHTEHKGRDARIAQFDKRRFDHNQTNYALRGRHQSTECEKCHVPPRKYREAPSTCIGCHRNDDTHKGSLGTACADCHGETSWKEARFDHDKTNFTLTGKHRDTPCADCHRNARSGDFKGAAKTCIGCHKKDDEGPRGHKSHFGERCDSCHGTRAFKPATFNHDTATKFALRFKHRTARCTDCHAAAPARERGKTACADCHGKDDKHKGALGNDCAGCHSERDWAERGKFDHSRTRFALHGKHLDTPCNDCHKSADRKNVPSDCLSCHKKDDKHAGTLGTACADCHNEAGWKPAPKFDHQRTRFQLRNGHAKPLVKCNACHVDAQHLRGAPMDCFSCHKKDDKHAGTLGTACADCHRDTIWTSAPGFNHERTRFPLRGAHGLPSVKCAACHADARRYRGTAMTCIGCHKKDDKHAGTLGEGCDSCHNEREWKTTRFDHRQARFVLVGRHQLVRCESCHKTQRYREAPRDCNGCHAKDDKHKLKYGTGCDNCHNARAWALWEFDHAKTRFALDGAHQALACESCHTQPAPSGRKAAPLEGGCYGCHKRDDAHDGSYGKACERCHVTDNWKRVRRGVSAAPPGPAFPEPVFARRALLASFPELGRGTATRATGVHP